MTGPHQLICEMCNGQFQGAPRSIARGRFCSKRCYYRRWYLDHRAEQVAAARKRYLKNRDKVRARAKQRYQDHREQRIAATRKWAQENPDKVREYSRAKRARNPGYYAAYYAKCREENLEYNRQYYAKNADRVRAKQKQWYLNHRERMLAWQKKWAEANAGKVRAIRTKQKYRRRTLLKAAGGSFTAAEWESLCARFQHRCALCGRERKLTVDHIVPVSRGGSNLIANIQPLCGSCNSRKSNKLQANF